MSNETDHCDYCLARKKSTLHLTQPCGDVDLRALIAERDALARLVAGLAAGSRSLPSAGAS